MLCIGGVGYVICIVLARLLLKIVLVLVMIMYTLPFSVTDVTVTVEISGSSVVEAVDHHWCCTRV